MNIFTSLVSKRCYTVILKVLSNKTIITIENFLFHGLFKGRLHSLLRMCESEDFPGCLIYMQM